MILFLKLSGSSKSKYSQMAPSADIPRDSVLDFTILNHSGIADIINLNLNDLSL